MILKDKKITKKNIVAINISRYYTLNQQHIIYKHPIIKEYQQSLIEIIL